MKYKFFFLVCGISVLLSLWAVSPWLLHNNILYFWDSYLPFDPKISFESLFYFWREGLFPGYSSAAWSWLPYWGLFFLPYFFAHSLSISEGFVYVLLLSLSIVNFYLLSLHILNTIFNKENKIINHIGSLAVAVVYAFNVYTFFNFYFMFNPGAFILALLPLNLLSLIHLYPLDTITVQKKGNGWLAIYVVSLIGMAPGFSVYVFFLQYLVWLSLYFTLYWISSKQKLKSVFTLQIFLFFLFIILINLWWFIPALLGFKTQYGGQSSFGTSEWFDKGFKPSQLLHALRLMGSGLMINNKFPWSPLYEENTLFTFPLLIFPLLFVSSFAYLKKKMNPLLVLLCAMAIISLFIVKFSNPPYAWILGLGYHYIPFFGGFRDAFQKAGVFFSFSYFIFIAIGLTAFINYLLKKNIIFTILFILAFLIGCVILSGPFFLFNNNNIRKIPFTFQNKEYEFSAKTQIPPEYYLLKKNIEDKCKGETVMLIPRSGFVTDGVWSKYNTSYVGQDILSSLINCNFLSTAMFTYYSESAIRAPYLLLQHNDIESFKNYMRQNGITYVLVRKDFLPQGFVTWIYVDPQHVEEQIIKDTDFKKIYINDFFSLYALKNQMPHQYGFKITQNLVQFQSDLKSGVDYTTAAKVIGNVSQPVIPNSFGNRKLYKNDTTIFTSIANCIGCVQIDTSSLHSSTTNTVTEIKNFIKSILHKQAPVLPPEIQISNEAVAGDRMMVDLANAVSAGNEKKFIELLQAYKNHWLHIENLLSSYNADKFSKNNKKMEVVNFLNREKNTVYSLISSGYLQRGRFLNKKKNRNKMVELFSFQKEILKNISNNIIQTDFKNNIYKMRLDIPKQGNYVCTVNNLNDNLDIDSVSVEGKSLNNLEYEGKTAVSFKQGSYLVNISYHALDIAQKKQISQVVGETKELRIGELERGAYKLSLHLDASSNGRTLIVVSQGRKSGGLLNNIDTIDEPGRNIILADQINKDLGSTYDYSRVFNIELPSLDSYYLYIFHLDPKYIPLKVSDIQIDRAVAIDDIQFACSMKKKNPSSDSAILSVIQESPVRYRIAVPENYKGFLVFNQAFDTGWVAHAQNESTELPHFISGFSNAWHIDNSKKSEIIVEYKTQSFAVRNAVITLIASLVVFLFYIKIRGR